MSIYIRTITEGRSDYAVLENILKGFFKSKNRSVDDYDLDSIRPKLQIDRSHPDYKKHQQEESEFSNWTLVLDECRHGKRIQKAYEDLKAQMPDQIWIIIQIDSLECDHTNYDVTRPDSPLKKKDLGEYVRLLREAIIAKIKGLLVDCSEELRNNCIFAVAVEETEAWILTLDKYNNVSRPTDKATDPKQIMKKHCGVQIIEGKHYEAYLQISKDFKDAKLLQKARLRNHSLHLFLSDLERYWA